MIIKKRLWFVDMPEHTIYIVNGYYRTGSTLVYIIIQKLMEYAETRYIYAGENKNQIDEIIKNPKSNYIIKTHDWKPSKNYENVKIIYTTRNPLDYIASKIIRGIYMGRLKTDSDNKPIIDDIEEANILNNVMGQIENQKRLMNRNDTLIIEYESLYYNVRKNVKRISKFINIKITDAILNRITDEVGLIEIKRQIEEIPYRGADAKTQIRHGHISQYDGKSGYWYKILPMDLISLIINILND